MDRIKCRYSAKLAETFENDDFQCPGRWTFSRALVKLDAAACWHSRRSNAAAKELPIRYINPDGSPQGREFFGAKLWEVFMGDYVAAVAVICPLLVLAHGHSSTIDKGMLIMHLAFLLAGPSAAGMRQWGLSLRAYLGDLGESYTPSIPDLVDVYLHGSTPERLAAAEGTLFMPNALPIPGPSHLLDWILYVCLTRQIMQTLGHNILALRVVCLRLPSLNTPLLLLGLESWLHWDIHRGFSVGVQLCRTHM